MSVPADHVPQDAALVDSGFMQVPGIVSTVENAEGFVIQAGAGADVGLAVVAFDVAVLAAGYGFHFLVGQGDDLLVQLVHILSPFQFIPFTVAVVLLITGAV